MYGHVKEYLEKQMQEGETVVYSFYVVELASFKEHLLFQLAALLKNKHNIVTITNKRLIVSQMDALGKMTGKSTFIEGKSIEEIKVKRGFFKTTVTLTIEGQPLVIKPNNICIGMPYHKESLVEMAKKFG